MIEKWLMKWYPNTDGPFTYFDTDSNVHGLDSNCPKSSFICTQAEVKTSADAGGNDGFSCCLRAGLGFDLPACSDYWFTNSGSIQQSRWIRSCSSWDFCIDEPVQPELICLIHTFPTAPAFYFGDVEYHVDESDGYVEVRVWRTGSDLSKTGTVTVRSRKTDPVSAEGMWF